MAPVIMAYIVTEFPQDKIAKGFAIYMLISSASVVFGPTLGGLIVSGYGWRSMLWVCIAICIATFAACLVTAGKEDTKKKKLDGFDGFGSILVLVFFGLILCIPAFGQNFGWTTTAFIVVLIASIVSLMGLIATEKKALHPILSGAFIKRKVFILSIATLFLTQGLMQANMTNTIVFVNYTQPGNSTISGYAISVMYLGMSLGSVLLGPLADKFEPKYVLTGSLILTGIGCSILLLFSVATSVLLLMISLGVLGFGLGGNGTVFLKVALSGLSQQEAGAGTGTYGLFRDLAAPFGVAVFVPLFTNRITNLISSGIHGADAAVQSIHSLAIVELFCIAAGIAAVFFLPKIHIKEQQDEIEK
jgi:MFS family permease